MLQHTRRSGMGGQPARGVKADDRRLQVGGQYQQSGYTTQGIEEVIAGYGGWDCEHHVSALRAITERSLSKQPFLIERGGSQGSLNCKTNPRRAKATLVSLT